MNRLYTFILFVLLNLIFCVDNINAAIQDNGNLLKLRAGHHSDFLRIVLEGPGALISEGRVNQKDNDIAVDFRDADFTIKNNRLPFTFRQNKNILVFSLKKFNEFKVFSLKNPSRLVIDVYRKVNKQKKQIDSKPKATIQERKTGEAKLKTKMKAKTQISHSPPLEKGGMGRFNKDNPETQKNKSALTDINKDNRDYSFISGKYEKVRDILKTGKAYAVLKELAAYKPDNAGSIAVYHFLYGEAYNMLKNYSDAVRHYRLAYIYSTDYKLKERALFKRAGAYQKIGLLFEARADYIVFIKNFPSSKYIEKAHLNQAKTLSEMGIYSEAVEHYGKAGNEPEALFGKANVLQKLERVEEARNVYANAMTVDKDYPKKSLETYYFIGENMLMAGEIEDAKRHLSMIQYGPFKGKAAIGLGLIAMEQSDADEAVRKFKSAARSRDKKIKVEALFNLHTAYLKKDKLKEAISSLEEIRNDYPNSYMYKAALLELSRLYGKDGRLKDSIYLLKELVYGKQPPGETFAELEKILLEASEKTKKKTGDVEFIDLWKEVGQWMLDESREKFLLKIAGSLRHEGKPFLDLSSWLIENASGQARALAAIDLADYYIGMGNIDISTQYLEIAKYSNEKRDDVLRVETKINRAAGDLDSALKKLMTVKIFEKNDLELLGNIIFDLMKKTEAAKAQEAIAFYEKILNESEWEAGDYIRLADILYEYDEKNRALKYYRIAYRKKSEDEWAVYRIGYGVGMPESKEMYRRLEKGDTLLSRLARTKLMEISLLNKVEEVY